METPYSRFIVGSLPWYSVLIVTGIVIAFFLGVREEKRLSFPKDTMVDVTLCAVPFGIIGARLYYVAFSWEQFKDNLLSILYIWQGGIAIYGSVIGGLLAVMVYAQRKKLRLSSLLDMVVPGLALAQAIGRWGNYFNQEAFGPLISSPALQFFPFGVLVGGDWHMATFFYESMWNLCVFLLLWLCVRKRQKQSGDVFAWYLLLYGAGRYWIEGLRTDSLMLGGVRFSQLLSLALCLGVLGWFALRMYRNGERRCTVACALLWLGAALLFFGAWPPAVYLIGACLLTAAVLAPTATLRADAAVLCGVSVAACLLCRAAGWSLLDPYHLLCGFLWPMLGMAMFRPLPMAALTEEKPCET